MALKRSSGWGTMGGGGESICERTGLLKAQSVQGSAQLCQKRMNLTDAAQRNFEVDEDQDAAAPKDHRNFRVPEYCELGHHSRLWRKDKDRLRGVGHSRLPLLLQSELHGQRRESKVCHGHALPLPKITMPGNTGGQSNV